MERRTIKHSFGETPCRRVLLEKLKAINYERNPPPFIEPEGSLPCSQKHATDLYPKPNETIPHASTLLLSGPF
jgi:hypothetical protein